MSWLNVNPERLGTRHIQVFVPSVDRYGDPIPRGQKYWSEQCLEVMGKCFGGGTAFPPARGVWRDDDNDGSLVYDDTIIVFSYVSESEMTDDNLELLAQFLRRLGREGNQGEVGIFVDGTYFGIQDFESPQEQEKEEEVTET